MKMLSFLTAICCALTCASAERGAAQGNSPAEKLGMFGGSWRSEGNLAPQNNAQPVHVSGTTTCSWSSSAHIFLVCDGSATFEGAPDVHHQLAVYTYDTASRQYGFANITTNTVTSPDLALSGNTWTYTGKSTSASGATTYFRTFNTFESPNLYRYRSESSTDNVHWTLNVEGTAHRL